MPCSTPVLHLFDRGIDPRRVERTLAELILGLIAAIEHKAISIEQAERDVFNLDVRQAAQTARLDSRLLEAFEWGMQLCDVVELSPDSLSESFDAIRKLCHQIIAATADVAA